MTLQHKFGRFHVEGDESSNLEIVKLSSSSEVVLNRPFINILCQVNHLILYVFFSCLFFPLNYYILVNAQTNICRFLQARVLNATIRLEEE